MWYGRIPGNPTRCDTFQRRLLSTCSASRVCWIHAVAKSAHAIVIDWLKPSRRLALSKMSVDASSATYVGCIDQVIRTFDTSSVVFRCASHRGGSKSLQARESIVCELFCYIRALSLPKTAAVAVTFQVACAFHQIATRTQRDMSVHSHVHLVTLRNLTPLLYITFTIIFSLRNVCEAAGPLRQDGDPWTPGKWQRPTRMHAYAHVLERRMYSFAYTSAVACACFHYEVHVHTRNPHTPECY